MNLRAWICYLASLLRIHNPDCEHCNVQGTCWVEMKKRLEDLNWEEPSESSKDRERRAS